uniref:Uncharacterized protein n=1 Tax=Anguilla anguilla TaxID=7936 RepID=A0A0E9RZ89_ANGAN
MQTHGSVFFNSFFLGGRFILIESRSSLCIMLILLSAVGDMLTLCRCRPGHSQCFMMQLD